MKLSKQNSQHPHQDNSLASPELKHASSALELIRTSVFNQLDILCSTLDTEHLGIAVSGGSDSLGLLLLCTEWTKKNNVELHALTVDHGLRKEAKAEADYVAQQCQILEVEHSTLHWSPPDTNVTQETTRDIRHQFFADWTREKNIKSLLLGHTLDDRLETMLMRERSGSSEYGLAPMLSKSPSPIWPQGRHLSLVRPANKLRRHDLEAILQAQDISWLCDPSNENPKYERVRVRKELANFDEQALNEAIQRLDRFSSQRHKVNAELLEFSNQHMHWNDDGSVDFALEHFLPQSPAIQARILMRAIDCVSSNQGQASLQKVQSLTQVFSKLAPNQNHTACLGGAWIHVKNSEVMICAMPTKRGTTRNAPQTERLTITPDTTTHFQGRFDIELSSHAPKATVYLWDELNIIGCPLPTVSDNKKARRSYPILVPENQPISEDINLLENNQFKITCLHQQKWEHLSSETSIN